MKKRSGFQVMARLIGLVKPLAGYMFLAIFKMCIRDSSILFAAAVAALCSGVKIWMKKILKGGQNHDDKQTAHRHGS